jgi:hypothetical protein
VEETTPIPTRHRLTFGHAAVQNVAARHGVDILHIKGESLDQTIVWPGRRSTDSDVLVRPEQSDRLLAALRQSGWALVGGFGSSSAFEHSATLRHTHWGHLDVHRLYPGFARPAPEVFQRLWTGRHEWLAAGVPCPVPEVAAQRVILILHAARAGASARARADIDAAWTSAAASEREQVTALVHELSGEVAFAAAVGGLEAYRSDPSHDLWRVVSSGGTRLEEWRARVKATPTLSGKARLVLRAPLVNVDHLTALRGSPPTKAEIVAEFFARPLRGVREELRRRRQDGA